MIDIQLSEVTVEKEITLIEMRSEKERLTTEYVKLLADRDQIVVESDIKMRESVGTETYVEVVKEKTNKVEKIDAVLTASNIRIKEINAIIGDSKAKTKIAKTKIKSSKNKKGDEDDFDDDDEE